MKSLMRLWAFSLIVTYFATLLVPAVALATTTFTGAAPSCSISITPSVIEAGGSATLKWTSTNATGGAITNVGNVGPSGNTQILPPTTRQVTTYIGSFTGPGGTANCSASVQLSYGNASGSGDSGTLGGSRGNEPVSPNPPPTTPAPTYINTGGTQGALVQCGTGAGILGATSCQACNLAQLVQNIINFCIGLSIPIAAVLFAWAGILYFTSGANPTNKETAKKIFSSALIGFLIAITSWLVINTLLHVLLKQSEFPNSSWFSIQCSNNRPVTGDINKILSSILPGVQVAPVTPSYGYGGVNGSGAYNGNAAYSCESGYNLSTVDGLVSCDKTDGDGNLIDSKEATCTSGGSPNENGQCTDLEGNIILPSSAYGTSGKQCSESNPACSIEVLQALGYEPQEANAMSCIAVTESGGNPYTKPSETGACGLFQITNKPGNWSNPKYHTGSCSVSSSCNDPYCNAQAAQLMFNEQGYQPWTGIDPKTGQPWNQRARDCVQQYDPQAFNEQVL